MDWTQPHKSSQSSPETIVKRLVPGGGAGGDGEVAVGVEGVDGVDGVDVEEQISQPPSLTLESERHAMPPPA